MKSLPWARFILIIVGVILLCLVSGIIWLINNPPTVAKWSLDRIRLEFLGEHQGVVHQVVGWGSERDGFDDGSDWIEFLTDSESLPTLIKMRQYMEVSSDEHSMLKYWANDMDDWGSQYDEYWDGSEESQGTDYFMFAVPDGDDIRILLARSQI